MARNKKQQPSLFNAPDGKHVVCYLPVVENSRLEEILQRIPAEGREAITMEFQANKSNYGQTHNFFVQNPVEIL
jgi:hypothetical protein